MSQLRETVFARGKAFLICDDSTKRVLLERLAAKYGIRVVGQASRKPRVWNASSVFGTAGTTRDADMVNLSTNPHVVYVSGDGKRNTRFYMYFTRIKIDPVCVMIHTYVSGEHFFPKMYVVPVRMPGARDLDETLLHGELAQRHDDAWTFMIDDMLVHRGEYLVTTNFVRRINRVYDILQTSLERDDADPFDIRVRRFYKYDEVDAIIDRVAQLAERKTVETRCSNPAIVFKSLHVRFNDVRLPLASIARADGTDVAAKKPSSKARKQPTPGEIREFGIRTTSSSDVYELLARDMQTVVGNACVNTMDVSRLLRAEFEGADKHTIKPVRCLYDADFRKWVPISVAPPKLEPSAVALKRVSARPRSSGRMNHSSSRLSQRP
jgi:hypothetical protein